MDTIWTIKQLNEKYKPLGRCIIIVGNNDNYLDIFKNILNDKEIENTQTIIKDVLKS